jgi:hypothetical protein
MVTLTLSLAVFVIISIWAYFRIKMRRMMELAEKIPGPKTLPLLGNVLEFGTNTKGRPAWNRHFILSARRGGSNKAPVPLNL